MDSNHQPEDPIEVPELYATGNKDAGKHANKALSYNRSNPALRHGNTVGLAAMCKKKTSEGNKRTRQQGALPTELRPPQTGRAVRLELTTTRLKVEVTEPYATRNIKTGAAEPKPDRPR